MSAAATTTATSRSCRKVSTPSANATGIVSNAANRARSIVISTGRLRRNSTHGPSGTATAAPTAAPTEESAATSAGPACSTRMAISGRAPKASHVPSALVPYAPQSHPNGRPSRCPLLMPDAPRHSPRNRSATGNLKASTIPGIKQPRGRRTPREAGLHLIKGAAVASLSARTCFCWSCGNALWPPPSLRTAATGRGGQTDLPACGRRSVPGAVCRPRSGRIMARRHHPRALRATRPFRRLAAASAARHRLHRNALLELHIGDPSPV